MSELPGSVYRYDMPGGERTALWFHARTVGDCRAIALKVLKERIEAEVYKDGDLIAAEAILLSAGKAPWSEQWTNAAIQAEKFLSGRAYVKGEGFDRHPCSDTKLTEDR